MAASISEVKLHQSIDSNGRFFGRVRKLVSHFEKTTKTLVVYSVTQDQLECFWLPKSNDNRNLELMLAMKPLT